MSVVCGQCRRVNPAEAYYCYFDGAALAGRTTSGPINLGTQPFPSPFVFASGLTSRNFDQLAMACEQHWKEALEMLQEGFFASFFATIGRADLALAAKEAAKFPDVNRGLDELLGKLPTQVLEAPKLRVEPTEINLGQMSVGTERTLDLKLENQGMRLVFGSVTSDVPWLTLGEAPGNASRIFDFTDEMVIPIQVRGKSFRARTKPQDGHLVIESNAGNFILTFKVEVPPVAFTEGILGGALSPRQIAEKAKANPTGAAPHFENGSVARWFEANGLTYPVQGPTAPGMAGVQQFFEALGLAKPPKVEFTPKPIVLTGDPGQVFDVPLEVMTQEKKPVYAYATADQPWIDGNTAKPSGRTCAIRLRVTTPARPGESLKAKVTVHANGNQKFSTSLTLTVKGVKPPEPPVEFSPAPTLASAFEAVPNSAFEPIEDEAPAAPAESLASAFAGIGPSAFEPIDDEAPAPASPPAPPPSPSPSRTPTPSPPMVTSSSPPDEPAADDDDIAFSPASPSSRPTSRPSAVRSRWWLHAVPAGLLAVVLLGIVVRDFFAAVVGDPIDPVPRIRLEFDYAARPDPQRKITNSLMFGLHDMSDRTASKRLTFSPLGQTNTAVFLLDGNTRILGNIKHGKLDGTVLASGKGGKEATFIFTDEKLVVQQNVQLVAGDPVQVSEGVFKRLYDTCLVRYTITNQDQRAHDVGFRFLLDTYIGMNDGTPFTIPGASGLVRDVRDFRDRDVPDYIQALERPDLKNPGTIAQLNLKIGGKYESPNRVSLTRYPGYTTKFEFDVPIEFDDLLNPVAAPKKVEPKKIEPKKGAKVDPKAKAKAKTPPDGPVREGRVSLGDDSAIAIYWKSEPLAPGATRELGFTYGVGSVAGMAELTILNPGPVIVGGEFSLVALVADARKGTQATLELPEGLELVDDKTGTLEVAASAPDSQGKLQPSPATWRIRALRADRFALRVTSGGITATRVITISKNSVF